MNLHDIRILLTDTLRDASKEVLQQQADHPPLITKAEAYRMYGRTNVDRWISEGLLLPVKPAQHTSKPRIDRQKLHDVASRSNRTSYLPVAER